MSNADKQLHLDPIHGMIGGVCAGLGNYFGISRVLIRIGFIVATFTWLPTLLVYGLLWFALNERPQNFQAVRRNLANNRVTRHLRRIDYRKRLYKNRRDGKLMGVCAGIGDYLEINPFWVRLILLVSLFFGPLAILVYIVAAFIMDDAPPGYLRQDSTRSPVSDGPSGGRAYRDVNSRNIQACNEKFSRLEQKLQRLEATITSKKFKLHSEFKRMS